MTNYDSDSDSNLNSDVSSISCSFCMYDSDDTESIDSDDFLWPSPSHYEINDDEDSFELITRVANSNIQNASETKSSCDR